MEETEKKQKSLCPVSTVEYTVVCVVCMRTSTFDDSVTIKTEIKFQNGVLSTVGRGVSWRKGWMEHTATLLGTKLKQIMLMTSEKYSIAQDVTHNQFWRILDSFTQESTTKICRRE